MTEKSAKKIGFWSALAILIGTVVGIGIFFKNGSVASAVENNGIGWLIAWILGAVVALFTALSYSEIGSAIPGKRSSGLSYWANKFSGKKLGYFTRFSFSFFYIPILIVVLGFFASEFFFGFLSQTGAINFAVPVYVHVIFGTFISFIYIVINKISIRLVAIQQNIVTILKFAPIIISIIVGFAFVGANQIPESTTITTTTGENGQIFTSFSTPDPNAFFNGKFNFGNVLRALPGVLFAFDAFLIVGTLTNKVKGGAKTVSKVVIVGMIFTALIYILITIVSIIHNSGSVGGVILDSIDPAFASAMTAFVFFFIFISAIGVINGFTSAYITEMENGSYAQTWFGSQFLVKKYGYSKTSTIFLFITYLFWWLILVIPALLMNSDELFDAASNYPTLFFFVIYGLIILFYSLKRKRELSTKKINKYLFYTGAWIAIIGILITVLSQYIVGIQIAVVNGQGSAPLGIFASKSLIKNIDFLILNFVFLGIFLLLPTINYLLIKYVERRDPLELPKEALEKIEEEEFKYEKN